MTESGCQVTAWCPFMQPVIGGMGRSISPSHNSLSVIHSHSHFLDFHPQFPFTECTSSCLCGWMDPRVEPIQLASAAFHQSHSQQTMVNVIKRGNNMKKLIVYCATHHVWLLVCSSGDGILDVLSGANPLCCLSGSWGKLLITLRDSSVALWAMQTHKQEIRAHWAKRMTIHPAHSQQTQHVNTR